MFRKILLLELRSAARLSRPCFSKTEDGAQVTKRINFVKPLCLSYAEYCSMRLQCQNTNHNSMKPEVANCKRTPPLIQYSFIQSQNFRTNNENNMRTFGSSPGSLEYLKSTSNISSVWKPVLCKSLSQSIVLPSGVTSSARFMATGKNGFSSIRNRISSLQARKRAPKKKKTVSTDSEEDWQVRAYATGDEYDLDGLLEGLTHQGLYTAAAINPDAHDVLHMVATYQVGSENREIYFFREGSVVFWNVSELECSTVLLFLKKYEKGCYKKEDVEEESENLAYTYSDTASKTKLVRNRIVLNPEGATDLEKYTFSNAMAMSVKLGIWEASLDKYIDDIEYVSEDLSKTGHVSMSQDQVLQCMGQLCALRHLINLSSDLLDTPDFYWEHENLELLYQKTSNYLNVSKRTSVMNVKLSHCVELMELLKGHLNEQHASRLEWIIIILIMIEVGFEVLHVAERWL